ncbi:unnamed protein product [Prorocentrum cordatum]|uniref:Uncharacterized protein n=1 Tax=Prorocentrum cordatum TaxID=2364126 RepID=A0ABN9UNJ1_9DINO|nr:unnamed protein product [Polarella glacialis]
MDSNGSQPGEDVDTAQQRSAVVCKRVSDMRPMIVASGMPLRELSARLALPGRRDIVTPLAAASSPSSSSRRLPRTPPRAASKPSAASGLSEAEVLVCGPDLCSSSLERGGADAVPLTAGAPAGTPEAVASTQESCEAARVCEVPTEALDSEKQRLGTRELAAPAPEPAAASEPDAATPAQRSTAECAARRGASALLAGRAGRQCPRAATRSSSVAAVSAPATTLRLARRSRSARSALGAKAGIDRSLRCEAEAKRSPGGVDAGGADLRGGKAVLGASASSAAVVSTIVHTSLSRASDGTTQRAPQLQQDVVAGAPVSSVAPVQHETTQVPNPEVILGSINELTRKLLGVMECLETRGNEEPTEQSSPGYAPADAPVARLDAAFATLLPAQSAAHSPRSPRRPPLLQPASAPHPAPQPPGPPLLLAHPGAVSRSVTDIPKLPARQPPQGQQSPAAKGHTVVPRARPMSSATGAEARPKRKPSAKQRAREDVLQRRKRLGLVAIPRDEATSDGLGAAGAPRSDQPTAEAAGEQSLLGVTALGRARGGWYSSERAQEIVIENQQEAMQSRKMAEEKQQRRQDQLRRLEQAYRSNVRRMSASRQAATYAGSGKASTRRSPMGHRPGHRGHRHSRAVEAAPHRQVTTVRSRSPAPLEEFVGDFLQTESEGAWTEPENAIRRGAALHSGTEGAHSRLGASFSDDGGSLHSRSGRLGLRSPLATRIRAATQQRARQRRQSMYHETAGQPTSQLPHPGHAPIAAWLEADVPAESPWDGATLQDQPVVDSHVQLEGAFWPAGEMAAEQLAQSRAEDHFAGRRGHPPLSASWAEARESPSSYLTAADRRRIQQVIAEQQQLRQATDEHEQAPSRPPSRGGESWQPFGDTISHVPLASGATSQLANSRPPSRGGESWQPLGDTTPRVPPMMGPSAPRSQNSRPPSRGGESWQPLGDTTPLAYEEVTPEMYAQYEQLIPPQGPALSSPRSAASGVEAGPPPFAASPEGDDRSGPLAAHALVQRRERPATPGSGGAADARPQHGLRGPLAGGRREPEGRHGRLPAGRPGLPAGRGVLEASLTDGGVDTDAPVEPQDTDDVQPDRRGQEGLDASDASSPARNLDAELAGQAIADGIEVVDVPGGIPAGSPAAPAAADDGGAAQGVRQTAARSPEPGGANGKLAWSPAAAPAEDVLEESPPRAWQEAQDADGGLAAVSGWASGQQPPGPDAAAEGATPAGGAEGTQPPGASWPRPADREPPQEPEQPAERPRGEAAAERGGAEPPGAEAEPAGAPGAAGSRPVVTFSAIGGQLFEKLALGERRASENLPDPAAAADAMLGLPERREPNLAAHSEDASPSRPRLDEQNIFSLAVPDAPIGEHAAAETDDAEAGCVAEANGPKTEKCCWACRNHCGKGKGGSCYWCFVIVFFLFCFEFPLFLVWMVNSPLPSQYWNELYDKFPVLEDHSFILKDSITSFTLEMSDVPKAFSQCNHSCAGGSGSDVSFNVAMKLNAPNFEYTAYPVLLASNDFENWWLAADKRDSTTVPFFPSHSDEDAAIYQHTTGKCTRVPDIVQDSEEDTTASDLATEQFASTPTYVMVCVAWSSEKVAWLEENSLIAGAELENIGLHCDAVGGVCGWSCGSGSSDADLPGCSGGVLNVDRTSIAGIPVPNASFAGSIDVRACLSDEMDPGSEECQCRQTKFGDNSEATHFDYDSLPRMQINLRGAADVSGWLPGADAVPRAYVFTSGVDVNSAGPAGMIGGSWKRLYENPSVYDGIANPAPDLLALVEGTDEAADDEDTTASPTVRDSTWNTMQFWDMNKVTLKPDKCFAARGPLYLVACAVNSSMYGGDGFELELAQTVAPPPFNDRCLAVTGRCAYACAHLDQAAPLEHCLPDGTIDFSKLTSNFETPSNDGYAVNSFVLVLLIGFAVRLVTYFPGLFIPYKHPKYYDPAMTGQLKYIAVCAPSGGETKACVLRNVVGAFSGMPRKCQCPFYVIFCDEGHRHPQKVMFKALVTVLKHIPDISLNQSKGVPKTPRGQNECNAALKEDNLKTFTKLWVEQTRLFRLDQCNTAKTADKIKKLRKALKDGEEPTTEIKKLEKQLDDLAGVSALRTLQARSGWPKSGDGSRGGELIRDLEEALQQVRKELTCGEKTFDGAGVCDKRVP